MFEGLFLRKLPQLYNIEFFGDHHGVTLVDRGKLARIATIENRV
jgi:hypothetical protein